MYDYTARLGRKRRGLNADFPSTQQGHGRVCMAGIELHDGEILRSVLLKPTHAEMFIFGAVLK